MGFMLSTDFSFVSTGSVANAWKIICIMTFISTKVVNSVLAMNTDFVTEFFLVYRQLVTGKKLVMTKVGKLD